MPVPLKTIGGIGFSRDLDLFAKEIEATSVEMEKKLIMQVVRKVAVGTPVDTGRMSANWTVSFRGPWKFWKDVKPGYAGRTISISNGHEKVKKLKKLQDAWVSNAVPYAIHVDRLKNITGMAVASLK